MIGTAVDKTPLISKFVGDSLSSYNSLHYLNYSIGISEGLTTETERKFLNNFHFFKNFINEHPKHNKAKEPQPPIINNYYLVYFIILLFFFIKKF